LAKFKGEIRDNRAATKIYSEMRDAE